MSDTDRPALPRLDPPRVSSAFGHHNRSRCASFVGLWLFGRPGIALL